MLAISQIRREDARLQRVERPKCTGSGTQPVSAPKTLATGQYDKLQVLVQIARAGQLRIQCLIDSRCSFASIG